MVSVQISNHSFRVYAVFSVLLAVVSGCVSSSKGQYADRDTVGRYGSSGESVYRNVYVYDVETNPVLKSDYAAVLQKCQSALIASLQKRNMYDKVEDAKQEDVFPVSTLLVKLKISDMRIASTGARIWGGALVGSSYMYIHMTLVDAETQAVVREEDFNSSNNAFAAAWTFGATDRNMAIDMAEIMAAYISGTVQKTK